MSSITEQIKGIDPQVLLLYTNKDKMENTLQQVFKFLPFLLGLNCRVFEKEVFFFFFSNDKHNLNILTYISSLLS